ncbi:C-type lectin domain family 4 member G-like isoform X2 [Micropterus salmoides]|uniref:C-type lectin domain family 4 member G-like isoform X2 n=1 Tax=Micropterus salmoides TaxID=27706 RepID=UPI0018EA6860|nr:C-type lectin domain family 4 member G-like isoform X2 [Micropterus salmoides]
MAEEVNYASVVFKKKKHSPPKAKEEEEPVYNEVRVPSKRTEDTADTNAKEEEEPVYHEVTVPSKRTEDTADTNVSAGLLPDKSTDSRGRCYQQVACCLGILCVILLLGFISVCVCIATISNQSEKELKENQTALLALNHNLTQDFKSNITKLSAENQNLISQNTKLSAENQNLISQNTKLSAENQNLTSQNAKLTAENQNLTSQNTKLSAENQNLTSQNQQLETQRRMENELNVSRAQWSIDTFCPKPKNQNRTCKACQDGWLHSQSSCYVIHNPDVSGQKTWEEARENCRGKSSDLAVIVDETEKTFISKNSWGSSGTKGYWIGLRAEDEKWNSWIQQPATNSQCVISVQKEGWKSVSCGARNFWICKKKALSV